MPEYVTDERPPRPDIELGTTAHYTDPEYYDRAYKRHRADVDFYLQTALEQNGPILELGCGTGRVLYTLARAGLQIVGIDSSAEMLTAARSQLELESDRTRKLVELRRGDIRKLELDRRFRLVISPFNVLQHLYSRLDIERCLTVVRQHLMPRAGLFVFDVLMPDIRGLGRNPERKYKLGQVYHPAGDKRYDYRESFDYDEVRQIQYITMYFDDPDDPDCSFETPLCHRQFYPAELEALLHYNGFEIVQRFGEFDRAPLDDYSESQIYVCRLARGARGARTHRRTRTSTD